MKKIIIALTGIISILTVSCEIGLGSSVDTDPPSITISNPPVDAIIRDDFSISGTWSDDGSIDSISVKLERTDGNGSAVTFAGVFSEDSKKRGTGTWYSTIPAKTNPVTDGTYQAVVTIKDATGRTTIQNTTFTIDNTAPVLILQRPATDISTTDEASIDTFGKIFTLEGRAADDNNIDHINVKIYSDAAKTNHIHTITLKNVPLSIALDAAKWGDEAYNKIYGTTVGDKQRYYCSIEAYDAAQRYPAQGSEASADDANGNCATEYYLYNEIANSSLADLKVTELYSALNGTASRSALDPNTVKSTLESLKKSTGTFFLNPQNNPTFKLSSWKARTDSDDGFIAFDGTSISFDVEPGLDGYPVNKGSLKVYLVEAEYDDLTPRAKAGAPKMYLSNESVTITGASTYKVAVKIDRTKPVYDENGKNISIPDPDDPTFVPVKIEKKDYIAVIEGKDSKENTLYPASDITGLDGYPIKIASATGAPELSVSYKLNNEVNNDAIIYVPKYKNGESGDVSVLTLSGTVTVSTSDPGDKPTDFYVYVDGQKINNPQTNESYNASALTRADTDPEGQYKFSNINISFTGASKTHSVVVVAENGSKAQESKSIWYDADGPQIEIQRVSPEAYIYQENGTKSTEKYLNGDVAVTIFITDGSSGVQMDSTKPAKLPKIEVDGSAITTSGEITEFPFTKTISTSGLDNTPVTINVTAYDKAGNKSTNHVTYTVKQDTDKPYVVVSENPTKRTFTNTYSDITSTTTPSSSIKNVFKTGDTLRFKFIDDDNLASYTVYRKKIENATEISTITKTSAGVLSATEQIDSGKEYDFAYTLPSQHGIYAMWIDVRDENGNERSIPERNEGEETAFYVKVKADAPVLTLGKDVWVTTNTENVTSTATNYALISVRIDGSESPFTVTRKGYKATETEPASADDKIKNFSQDDILTVALSPASPSYAEVTDYFNPKDYITSATIASGTYNIKYFVVDQANSSSQKTTTYNIDNDRPEAVISSSAPTIYDLSNTFKGSITEDGSGVDKVQVTFVDPEHPDTSGFVESRDVKEANGSSSWYFDAVFGEGTAENPGLNLSEGPNTFFVRAIDKVGNIGDWVSQSFTYDKEEPVIEIQLDGQALTDTATQTKTAAYTFKYKAHDSNGLAATNGVKLTVTKNGANTPIPASDIEETTAGGWTTVTVTGTSAGDGTYKYTIEATDKAGKTSKETRTIKLDTKAPVIEVTSPDFTGYQNSASITVKGTCEDDSGTYAVWYNLKNNGDAAPAVPSASNTKTDSAWTGLGWKKAGGTSSWTASEGLSGVEGSPKVIYFAAVDGNAIASSTLVSKNFKVDLSNPVITETGIDEGKAYKNGATGYTFSGTARDPGSGIKSIVITGGSSDYGWYDSTCTETTTSGFTYNSSDNKWSYTVAGTEGEYNYTITVKDGADKTSDLSRSLVYDVTKPKVGNVPVSEWYKTRTITLQPVVTDLNTAETANGSGVDTVEASIIPYDEDNPDADRAWVDIPPSNGSYKGTVDFTSDGPNKEIYIRAKDKAGNVSLEKTVTVNIDTTEPDLDKARYNVEGTEVKDVGGTVFVNGSKSVTVYGSYSDDLSGVKALTFIGTGIKENANPAVTYSTGTLAEGAKVESLFAEGVENQSTTITTANSKNIKYWKVVFSKDDIQSGTLKVKGENNAGGTKETSLFQLVQDTTPPTFTKIKIDPNTDNYSVFSTKEGSNDVYYLNNKEQTFTISGVPSDVGSSVDKVYLKIENVNAEGTVKTSSRKITDDNALGNFSGIEFKETDGTVWTDGAKVTITITDIAGNSTVYDTILRLKFDTQGPQGVHALDSSENGGKDLYFRIGDGSRDDFINTNAIGEPVYDDDGNATVVTDTTTGNVSVTYTGVPDWDLGTDTVASKDKDVGGKYSGTTYGNAETVKIRGKYVDDGSGLSLIYYKIYNTQPNSTTTANFLRNYKTDNDGYFSPLKTPETRRVFYTGSATEFTGSTSKAFTPVNGGTVKKNNVEQKNFTDIENNYKTTIPSLNAGENYLVFVAVDNVGNAALESVTHNSVTYDNYRINVDYEAPSLNCDVEDLGLFKNDKADVTVGGTVSDNSYSTEHEGIRSVWLKYDDDKSHWIKANVNESAGTWSATIAKSILEGMSGSNHFTVTATDNSGSGNTKSSNFTLTIDNDSPNVDISLDTTEYKIGGTNADGITQVNDTIKIKTSASDVNGLKTGSTLELYYTTVAGQKDAVTDISKWTKYTATNIDSNNSWTINVTNDGSLFTDGTTVKTYYFTVKAVDKADNIGYATPLALEVNKDTDRPVIKLNMTFPANAENAIVSDNAGIDGTIKDDDGNPAVDKVWCYVSDTNIADVTTITNTDWKKTGDTGSKISYNATSGSFTINPGDGTKYVYFRIEDKGGKTFITKAATAYDFNSPKITNKDETVTYGAVAGTATRIVIKTDTTPPLTSSFAYLAKNFNEERDATSSDPNGWSSSTGSAVLGGTANNTFRVRLYAYDINGIESVTFKIPMNDDDPDDVQETAVQDSVDTSKSYYEYRLSPKTGTTGLDQNITIGTNTYTLYWLPGTAAIDVTGWASGARSCIIDTFDGTKHTTETYSFNIDTIPAEATFTSHSNNDQIRASFLLKGGFNDGDNKTSLKYITSLSANEPAATDWASATVVNNVGSNSWAINFDGGATEAQTTHGPLPKQIVANLTNKVIINDAGKAVYEDGVTGHTAGELYTTITTVYFHMLASDGIGNTKWSKIALRIDPQGDIPTIKMDYPAIGDEVTTATATTKAGLHYSKLSGYIRAQGSAEDDKNIVGIYMQIDSDFNMLTGNFDSDWETKECPGKTTGTNAKTKLADFGYTIEDMYTSYNTYHSGETGHVNKSGTLKGIRVGTSNSWNITLNTSNEFNKSSGNNYIAIKFYAVDEDGNISVWNDDDLVIVCVDSDAPKIGSSEPLYLHQYGFKKNDTGVIYYAKSASPAAGEQLYTTPGCTTAATDITYASANFTSSISTIEYKKDMWLNGEWWLTGSVEDESGISEIKIGGMGGTSIKNQCTQVAKGIWDNDTYGYRLNYKIGSTDTNNPGYGTLNYNLWVQDDTQEDSKKDTLLAISVQYDNKNPTLAATTDSDYLISKDVVNENSFYKVQSVVTEASGESGFDKVIFYFKRGSTVYDSYMPKAVAATNAFATTSLVEDSNIWWKSNTVTAIDGNKITVTADANIHKGGLVKLGGAIYKISEVNSTVVTLNGNPPALSAGETRPVYFAIGHVVDHAGTESEGTSKIAATQTNPNPYGLGYYANSPDDDGDLMLEKVSTGTTKTIWYGLINSRNIPDGAIEIHYVAFDKAGNMSHGSVTNAYVKNNGPRLASLRAWTDYNGNEAGFEDSADLTSAAHKEYESENEVKYYTRRDRKIGGKTVSRATAVTDNLIVTGNDLGIEENAAAFMRVTDQTQFYPEIVGGNGNLYYSYRIGEGATTEGEYSVNWTTTGNSGTRAFSTGDRIEYSDVSADYTTKDEQGEPYVNGSSVDAIPVDTTLLGTVGNGVKWFEYTIWDSTAGGTVYTNTLNAKFTVLLNVAYNDTTAPKAVISPFFWKSSSNNSLYQNSKSNGHIELENDLTGTVAEELYGSDPKVSGKITIRGTAYDDIRLSQLWVKFEDIGFANALTGTNPDISNRTGYKLAATYDRENGRWNVAGATMESNSWEFTATDRYCNKDGHLVDWELSVDTAKVSGNAVCNKNVYIMAVDQRGTGTNHYSSASDAGSKDDGVSVYNKPSYQMDIVPYITEIVTGIRTGGGLKSNNIRSASGKYSILSNNSDNKITVKGFNFCTTNTMLVAYITSVNPNTSSVSPYGKTLLSNETNVTTTEKTIRKLTIKANSTTEAVITNTGIDKSGYLELFSDGVRALNNINRNDAYGTATKKINNVDTQITATNAVVTDYENAYNREPDYYTTKNVQLTDDRYFRFFDMHKTNTKNGYYPVMIMDDDDAPVFGYVDSSGQHADDASTSMRFGSDMQPQRRKFNADGSYTTLNTEYLASGTTWDQMAMAKDEGGKYHQVSVYNRNGASMGYYYQDFAKHYNTSGWGYDGRQMGTGYQDYDPEWSQSGLNNALTLDAINAGTAMVDRFQNIKLIATGDSTTSAGATIYQAYFDDQNGSLIFRQFKVATRTISTVNVTNASFTYNEAYEGYVLNNSTAQGTNRSGLYVKIDNCYHKITRTRLYANGWKYYYTVENYDGDSFNSDIVTITNPDNSTWYGMYGLTCTNLNENKNTGAYARGRTIVTSSGSKFYDFGIISNRAVYVYYDFSQGRLRLMYSSVLDGNPETAVTFEENTSITLPDYFGQYVSMTTDTEGGIHIAGFDSNGSDLKYVYLTSYDADDYTEMTVDAAGSVGNWTSIKIDTSDTSHPYYNKAVIAYYNSTETGGHDAIKLAVANNVVGSVEAGIDSQTDYTLTGWEYMTVPSIDPAQGGSQKFQQVCLDFDSAGRPVVGYLGTNLEFGKALDE